MEKKEIANFKDFLAIVDDLSNSKEDIILYRGQSNNFSLLPSVARTNPCLNTTDLEKEMLNELKRRTQLHIKTTFESDWEWLVYAQHFGMKTRLLDWTSNPLTALWFACSNEYKMTEDSFVYVFTTSNSTLINTKSKASPFDASKTRVLRPALNNERIIAQAGWFTAHKFSNTAKCFVTLEKNKELKQNVIEITIPFAIKKLILKRLSIFGINSQTLFPDIVGVCTHINWMFTSN